jgi:hypothetical protein
LLPSDDLIVGAGVVARGALRFLVGQEVLGFLEGRRQPDVAILSWAKVLLSGFHEIDGRHDRGAGQKTVSSV